MTAVETKDLSDHLRAATTDLELRPGFADAVVRGGRRRRTRGRITIGTAVAATVAVAVAVAAGPTHLADPPADTPSGQDGHPLLTSGGDLVDDAQFVRLATTTWRESIPGTSANKNGVLNQPLNEPHVTWAGSTPLGAAAIVAQQFTMPKIASVDANLRGQPAIAVGLLSAPAEDTGRLELIGVQLEGHWARPGSFVFPDNRTVIAVAYASPPDSRALNISPNVTVGHDGVSRREWTKPLRYADGVWIGELPKEVNPRNVRMIDSKPDLDPNDAEDRVMGLHHPLLFTSEYLSGQPAGIPDRGLPWEPIEHLLGRETHLAGRAWDIFEDAVSDSGLLEPTSYIENAPRWTAVVGLRNSRTMIISSHQELDNPAYVFEVVTTDSGTVKQVTRGPEVDLSSPVRLVIRLPGDEGWVVAVDPDKQLRYRTGGSTQWSEPGDGFELLPADAVAVETGGQEFTLK